MPYIGVSPQFGVRRKHTYTATAGQTSFSGAGSEGATLSYTDSNFVDVYQNGVKLGDADYTSTSGTAIVLAQGASVNDLVEIIVFDAFSISDTVSKADGGTFDGNVTFAGSNLFVADHITHSGDSDTEIQFEDDTIKMFAGNTNVIQMVSNACVFNQDSADIDFRFEGNNDSSLLFLDAGEDNVKVGSNAGNYAILSIRNENAGSQERGLYVELAPASGTSPNNVAVFAAANSNMTQPVVRIHHESPAADGKLLTCTVTGSNTETFYLDEDGDMYVKGNTGMGQAPNNSKLSVTEQSGNETIANFANNASSSPYGLYVDFSSSAPDNTSNYAFRFEDSSTDRLIIYSDGDIYNHDGTYAQFSDERIKDNITDAKSQWDDIKAMRFVNYQRKDDILQYGKEDAKVQLGLIGQELEKISPNLVRQVEPNASDIRHSSELGTLYQEGDDIPEDKQVGDIKEVKDKVKGVAYSILYMKAVKCLQEAMTRIETLEAEVKALKG
jgi:hypothetical protein